MIGPFQSVGLSHRSPRSPIIDSLGVRLENADGVAWVNIAIERPLSAAPRYGGFWPD